jgi:hypothetical protein
MAGIHINGTIALLRNGAIKSNTFLPSSQNLKEA